MSKSRKGGRPPSASAMAPEEFKAWRQLMGWSQEDVAEKLSVAARTVQRWESGKNPIDCQTWLATQALTLALLQCVRQELGAPAAALLRDVYAPVSLPEIARRFGLDELQAPP